MSKVLRNPIIPGYYPDPSICRVGDDFYLVNSSFELWPGLPVFHSKDLIHWEQIANAVGPENDFHMERNCGVGGLMAPTLRYSNGKFYIINANFADKGNYIITADNPRGPWSSIHWLDDVPGIDASIFFDNDGKCYIIGTGNVWDNGTGEKERGIWLAEYDIEKFKLIGEPVCIYNSALRGGASPEAPHIYKKGEYYYLLTAEGGTEHYHAVMVARSKELFGFYEGNPANPVLTHRQMGFDVDIANVGHADLVELEDGSWYAVMLASRLIDGNHKNLGRETFICPVTWERDWPVFSAKSGRVDCEYPAPKLKEEVCAKENAFDDFDDNTLPLYWTFWGKPGKNMYSIEDSNLILKCISQGLADELNPMRMDGVRHDDWHAAYVARRQRSPYARITAKMNFWPKESESAGIGIVQAMNHQVHIERAVSDGKQVLRVVLVTADYNCPPYFPGFDGHTKKEIVSSVECEEKDIILQVELNRQRWSVKYGKDSANLNELTVVDGSLINPEKVGCMCGTMLGMFATGNGTNVNNEAKFDWFLIEQ